MSTTTLWTPEEDDILRRFFPSEGSAVSQRLPNRTVAACTRRANVLGIYSRVWSAEEDVILKTFLAVEGKRIVERLPGRSYNACLQRARDKLYPLPFPSRGWTEREDSLLKAFYPSEGNAVAKRLPGRTEVACLNRASYLGLRVRTDYWTQEEKDLLVALHKRGESPLEYFPGRSETAILEMKKRLGLKSGTRRWSKDELAYMKRFYSRLGPNRVAENLGRSYSSVTSMAARLGLDQAVYGKSKHSSGAAWSEQEDDILKECVGRSVDTVVSLLSGRTALEVEARRRELGLSRGLFATWTAEEDAILRALYPSIGADVSKRLTGRSASACVQRARVLGLQSGVR